MINFVLMEVGKKQGYIFKSNKLKENIGASMIISYVTERLPKENLEKYKGESVLEGGGKGLYKFSNEVDAKNFINELSRYILKKFSNLEIYFVKKEIDLEKDNISNEIKKLYIDLGKKKAQKKGSVKQISLGIEKICASTGLPATTSKNGFNISEEIESKINYYDKNINEYFVKNGVRFFKEIDSLLEKDEGKSYICVVHIDGNSMGNKFTKLSNYYTEKIEEDKSLNLKYLNELSKLSKDIGEIYINAFEKVIKESIEDNGYSYVRPIVVAGDDITFVAKAKDAIRLSRVFIEDIMKKSVNIGNENIPLNAAAGIAFIKSHYPFSRAYDLAEELTANCKRKIKSKNEDASMIDWHIVQGEDSSSITTIREKHYIAKDGLSLNLRPLYIERGDTKNTKFNSYENFKSTLETVHKTEVSRSKLKELREELIKGKEATEMYCTYYNLENYLDYMGNERLENGIKNNTAVFFDAIEIMDLVKEV